MLGAVPQRGLFSGCKQPWCVPASRPENRHDRERARVQSRVYFRSSLTTSSVAPRLHFSGRVHHVFPGGQMPKGPRLQIARPRALIPCRTMACAAGCVRGRQSERRLASSVPPG